MPIIAVEQGFFARNGLAVLAQKFTSGPAISEALYLGSADIGTMGDTAAIISISKTDRTVMIGCQCSGEHRHRMLVKQDSGFKTLADLRGKRIAVKKGTSTFGGLLAAMTAAHLAPSEFLIMDLPPETMIEALTAGSIDAFAASEPEPSLGELRGGRELMTFGGLGNSFPIMILAQKDLCRRRPQDLTRFLRALADAETYLQAHPAEATAMVARVTGLPLPAAANAMKRHDFRLRLDEEVLKSLSDIRQFLLDQKKIITCPDPASAADSRFLTSARGDR